MTTRLYAHASAAAALLLTAAACYAAVIGAGWPALGGLYTAVFFTWSATRCYAQARREHTVMRLLTRLAPDNDSVQFERSAPCCSFWLHSDGEVHAPGCPRPTETESTGLTPLEEREFAQIVADLHTPGSTA
ncbi:hypothetical protein ACKI1J_24310 [Streptomyces scabiei]|uniref:hypothetical protein n=1 Tax=Streptomyces TaxID=1883 RepID=UPI0038F6D051